MTQALKQASVKVQPRVYNNYVAFAERLGFTPYQMLKLVIETWAGAEDLLQRMDSGKTNEPEAFSELGQLVGHAKEVARLNGLFEDCMMRVAARYGVDLQSFRAGLHSEERNMTQEGGEK
ncbi:MAG: hypothetical protein ACOC6S_03715 [Chloroflexota bacterium]